MGKLELDSILGAKKDGVGGFAKGVGKGLIGAVVRPVSGVVDFASTSIHAVKTYVGIRTRVRRTTTAPRMTLQYRGHLDGGRSNSQRSLRASGQDNPTVLEDERRRLSCALRGE